MQILVQLCMLLTLNGIKSDLFAWKEELKILQMGGNFYIRSTYLITVEC